MNPWEKYSVDLFNEYINSFSGLSSGQKKNFQIKIDHSFRVAENIKLLAESLKINKNDSKALFMAGLFHDIGRFKQLIEFNTFNDMKSVDHASYSAKIIEEKDLLNSLDISLKELVLNAVRHHNKLELPGKMSERQLLFSRILRDADKIDILKVLTDYYLNKNREPNHTLTWELPAGDKVSPEAARDILSGKLVSREKVKNETDVKIMQLSWVYDLNFKVSFEIISQNRYLEKIYSTLSKNDTVIEIYRKIKVFAENKFLE
jgi:putative nucleotidyltransferase with HDIG domain